MKWYLGNYISTKREEEERGQTKYVWGALWSEVSTLAKQRCAYCSGYGHSGNNCPTDAKLSILRSSYRGYRKLLTEARKAARKKYPMAATTHFSSLSSGSKAIKKTKGGFISKSESTSGTRSDS